MMLASTSMCYTPFFHVYNSHLAEMCWLPLQCVILLSFMYITHVHDLAEIQQCVGFHFNVLYSFLSCI